MRDPRLRLTALLLVLAVLGAACNSTTRLEGATTLSDDGAGGVAVGAAPLTDGIQPLAPIDPTTGQPAPAAAGAAGATGSTGATGTTGGTTAGGTTTGPGGGGQPTSGGGSRPAAPAPAAGGGGGGGAPAPAPAPAAPAPAPAPAQGGPVEGQGVTATEIRIGFQVSTDLQAGFGAVGASGDAPDETRIVEALVAHVNEQGGIAGRQVVPVFHGTAATSGSWATQAQAACATFTEDNEVLAVASSPVGGSDALLACMAAGQTPLIEQNLWLFDQDYYTQFDGWLYQPGKMRADRWAGAFVDGLAQAGYFDGGTLGIARFDAPVFDRVMDRVVRPRLEAAGVTIADEAILSSPQSVSDFGRMGAEINNAILSFRANGVDRVMFVENAGIMPFFWLPSAESQGFRPRYGLSSASIPATIARQGPAEQLAGAMAVGWTPPNDTEGDRYPANDAAARCSQIMQERGIAGAAGFYTHTACDSMFFLQAVIPRMTEFSPAGFRAAAQSLGTAFTSPFALRSALAPDRPDGGASAQVLTYDQPCGCFVYTGQPFDVP
jgi:hypothetical protein